jgi:uncharacterized membrane protein
MAEPSTRSGSATRPGTRTAPATSVPRNARWAWWVTLPIALAGLGVSTYLTYVHFNNPAALPCSASGVVDCLKVTTSSQSEIFGHIPVAVTGLAYFFVMTLLMTPWAWRAANPWIGWLRLAGALSGVGMVLYLVYVEAVQLKALCLWCTGVHILTFLLFLAVLTAYLLRPIDPYAD